jgi:hypothetical protein
MNFTLVVIENIILFLLIPKVLWSLSQGTVRQIDDRNMFVIPFCSNIATTCGALLAIVFLLGAGVVRDAAPVLLWGFDGPWHTGRLMVLLATYVSNLLQGGIYGLTGQSGVLASTVTFLLACAAILTLINGLVAIAGWRSLQAIRGLAMHTVLMVSIAVIFIIWALTALWALHWLNFWVFLVLLCVIEMRRRETGTVRLSF